MLTPFDDYPIHQTALPVAHPSTGDPNHYDRYAFLGFDRGGGYAFFVALGCYPNRQVIDAAVSIVRAGHQYSVFASGRIPLDRTRTRVGPIRVSVEEPLRRLNVRVEANDHGIEADLTFSARSIAVEEPRSTLHEGARLYFDATRFVQWGTWCGSLRLNDAALPVDPATTLGVRDRSWGIRPVGGPPSGAPPSSVPQFYWIWAPVTFEDRYVHLARTEDAAGRVTLQSAFVLTPLEKADAPTYGRQEVVERIDSVGSDIAWRPGTRWARTATFTFTRPSGAPYVLRFEPLLRIQMMGMGYFNEEWGHGMWKGEEAVGGMSWKLDDLDPLAFPHLHVEQLCRVTMGERQGVGILEQLAIGPHAPSGLEGFADGAGGS